MKNVVQRVNVLGQSIWYDNISRGLIESGELQKLIDLGVVGLTSNPTIFQKAISGSSDYDDALLSLAEQGKTPAEIFEILSMNDIRDAADMLASTYKNTGGVDGYVSLEVNPHLARDTEGTVEEADRLFKTLGRPNVMIKIPATEEGIPAIRESISRGININVTLIFSLETYASVREAYVSGLESLLKKSDDIRKIASVASFFVSRVDTAVDTLLAQRIDDTSETKINGTGNILAHMLGTVAVANAKLAYKAFEESFSSERFVVLKSKGAHVQRPLWASTGTKNPSYSDNLYVDSLIGGNTVNTMPEATLKSFLDHGIPDQTVKNDLAGAQRAIDTLLKLGIDLGEITDTLLFEGVKAFADSYDQLIGEINDKIVNLRS